MSDPVLAMILAEAGCPYPEGSPDAVKWAQGFRAGYDKGRAYRLPEAPAHSRPPRRLRAC
jgi:hypothetical protein